MLDVHEHEQDDGGLHLTPAQGELEPHQPDPDLGDAGAADELPDLRGVLAAGGGRVVVGPARGLAPQQQRDERRLEELAEEERQQPPPGVPVLMQPQPGVDARALGDGHDHDAKERRPHGDPLPLGC